MLEAGISVVTINLPSLWLFLTSIMPKRLTRGLHNLLSPSSQQRNSMGISAAAASESTFYLHPDPNTPSSRHSGPLNPPLELSPIHYHQKTLGHQNNTNSGTREVEANAVHGTDGKKHQGEKAWIPWGEIQVEDTEELSREDMQRTKDVLC